MTRPSSPLLGMRLLAATLGAVIATAGLLPAQAADTASAPAAGPLTEAVLATETVSTPPEAPEPGAEAPPQEVTEAPSANDTPSADGTTADEITATVPEAPTETPAPSDDGAMTAPESETAHVSTNIDSPSEVVLDIASSAFAFAGADSSPTTDGEGAALSAGIVPGATLRVPIDVVDATVVRAAVGAPTDVNARIVDPTGTGTPWLPGSRLHSMNLDSALTGRFFLEIRNDSDLTRTVPHDTSYVRAGDVTLAASSSLVGEMLRVTGTLTRGGSPVSGASTTVTVSGPNGVSAPFPMTETTSGTYLRLVEHLAAGEYTLLIRAAVDGTDHTDVRTIYVARSNTTPADIGITLTPGSPDRNGWYARPVTVGIAATHPNGIQWMRYTVNDGAEVMTPTGTASARLTTDGVHSVQVRAAERLGYQSGPVTQTVRIDQTPPTIVHSGVLSRGRVAVGASAEALYACQDALSTVESCTLRLSDGTHIAYGDAIDTSVPRRMDYELIATDHAGNTTTEPGTLIISSDTTAPTLVVTTEPAASNARGWFARDVLATITASDTGSGVAWVEYRIGDAGEWTRILGNEANVPVHTDGTTRIWYRSADNDLNVTGNRSREISVDRVNPTATIDPSIDGAHVEIGDRLIASFSCADEHSGIYNCAGSSVNGTPLPTDAEGTFVLSATAIDRAGNYVTSRAEYTVGPVTVPTAVATPLVPANEHGWWNNDVEVDLVAVPASGAVRVHWELEGAQSGSGSAEAVTTVTITAEGDTRLNYWAEDEQGGLSEPTPLDVRVDRTVPTVLYAGIGPAPAPSQGDPQDPDLTLVQGEQLTLTALCADPGNGSGMQSCDSPFAVATAVPTETVGDFLYTTTATDRAGNVTVSELTVRIVINDAEEPGGHPGGQPGSGGATPPPAAAPGGLADTGGVLLVPAVAGAVLLVALGAAVALYGRRRHT